MDLHVLAIGKLKDEGYERACQEYVKRSRGFLPLARRACRDPKALWHAAATLAGPVVVMDERGEQPTSAQLAGWLGRWRDDSVRTVSFLIGDAHGFSEQERAKADRVLALSALTLPHRIAQVVLCEQLYRAGTILAGHPYHH